MLSALAAAPALSGCRELIEDVLETCPDDVGTSPVGWIPDIAHPVFAGIQDLTPAQGAPRNMLVYYPASGPLEAPILKQCAVRWPVVLFLHGMPPMQYSGAPWYRAWVSLPVTLARSGYVVIVPDHNAQLIENGPAIPVADAMRDIEFIRTTWADSEWVDKRPTSTVVAGHSDGAALATHLATMHEVGALACWSGNFILEGEALAALRQVTKPTFLMWGKGAHTQFEDLDQAHTWDGLTQAKYAAVFEGEHFDYVSAAAGGSPRGPCPDIGGMAGDLTALFVASNIFSLTQVGVDLRAAPVTLTPQQQAYADGHLATLGGGFTARGCRLDLRWNVGGATGTRSFGLP
jgi:hypothetical protein